MNYYTMRREVSQALGVLIEKREEWAFDRWFIGMMNKYGVSRRMIMDMLAVQGFTVENNKVIPRE